jgi:arabinose-5-phosphate isomerase
MIPVHNSDSPSQIEIKVDIQENVSDVLRAERLAIERLEQSVGTNIVSAIELLSKCHGNIVVTGIGKSGLVGRKIAASLSSTGTPAYFLHACEALHGDVGSINASDSLLAISYSGETAEVIGVACAVREIGSSVVAMTGNPSSSLARIATKSICVDVGEEADPFNLVPTSSTTATMAMGDAIALTLCRLQCRTIEDLARLHPAGTTGRRLFTKVSDLMQTGSSVPLVSPDTTLSESLLQMTQKRLGAVLIGTRDKRLVGIFTDGDLRRRMQSNLVSLHQPISSLMTRSPHFILPSELAKSALQTMETFKITVLPVVDKERVIVGAIHMHQIVSIGITN